MTNVHIVNHTHWDREWYFTSMDSLVLSDQLFSDVIEELKMNKEATFVLDGQISILDDYLELYPEKLEVIKELVANHQLFIGPWFTQTDAFFASGESILRNAMIGIFESKKYGEYLPIAYLPDTFGFNAQIPVILNEAGFESVIMWRGLNLNKHVSSPYFKWDSLNGEHSLTSINFPQGYGTGMLLEPTTDYVDGRLDKAVDFLKQYTDGDVIIPSGNDQLGIISNLAEKIEQINDLGKYDYQMSTYQDFITYVNERELEHYSGEFREPVLARVHKTVGSVRMDLKKEIFHLEDKLTYRIEPMMVIGKKLGIDLSNRLLLKTWKKLLESQAHDSLAGCVSDSVAIDIKHRLKEANEICDSIENIIMKRISEALNLTQNQVLVLNTSLNSFTGKKEIKILSATPFVKFEGHESYITDSQFVPSREDVLEETPSGNRFITEPGYYILTIEVACDIKGLGYTVLTFEESNEDNSLIESQETSIGTEGLKITYELNQVNLHINGKKISNFLSIEDEGNTGDTYDFSPLSTVKPIECKFNECRVSKNEFQQKMVLKGNADLPYTLEDRENGKYNNEFSYKLTLIMDQNSDIKGNIHFENTLLNHRVRLKVNLNDQITNSVSGLPFGFISKTNKELNGWQKDYSEMPVNVEPFEKTVSAITESSCVTVFTQDSKEYEYSDDSLFITLLATTDSLGKPNLLYRPGRASGDTTKKGHIMMETPLAQMENHVIDFNFAIDVTEADFSEERVAMWRSKHLQPSVYYQKQDLNYFIYRIDNKIQKRIQPLTLTTMDYSVIDGIFSDHIIVSSIHNSYYDEDAFVVRLENPTSQPQEITLEALMDTNDVTEINAIEEEQELIMSIPGYGLKSLLIKKK